VNARARIRRLTRSEHNDTVLGSLEDFATSRRWLDFDGCAHNTLLVSPLNLFGNAPTSYGHAECKSGALRGFTG
jgi:hypothetical protein